MFTGYSITVYPEGVKRFRDPASRARVERTRGLIDAVNVAASIPRARGAHLTITLNVTTYTQHPARAWGAQEELDEAYRQTPASRARVGRTHR